LFCVYLDELLKLLAAAKVGCFIGTIFVGVLAYADDLVLLAPTTGAMRRMLSICDCYASEYAMVFNAKNRNGYCSGILIMTMLIQFLHW
jgi:hypothetical protein